MKEKSMPFYFYYNPLIIIFKGQITTNELLQYNIQPKYPSSTVTRIPYAL